MTREMTAAKVALLVLYFSTVMSEKDSKTPYEGKLTCMLEVTVSSWLSSSLKIFPGSQTSTRLVQLQYLSVVSYIFSQALCYVAVVIAAAGFVNVNIELFSRGPNIARRFEGLCFADA